MAERRCNHCGKVLVDQRFQLAGSRLWLCFLCALIAVFLMGKKPKPSDRQSKPERSTDA